MESNTRNISDFLNKEYLEYSRATIEDRAIPSLCDGLKPGARKIFHAANAGTLKDGKIHKLLVLSGDTLNLSQYVHGDMSLNSTIAEKSKSFVNNIPGIEIEGQSGSLRNPDAVGSPRYLYIKKSKYMDMVYKTDADLLEYIFDEGMYLEPYHYLPIIPTILTSLAMGIGNGYSFHTMAYNPLDVINCCLDMLRDGSQRTMLRPYLNGVNPASWELRDGRWWSIGQWSINLSKNLLIINDLPYDVTYEDFEKMLNKYIDKGIIIDYKNLSEDGNIRYEVEFPKGVLKSSTSKEQIISKFKLEKQLPDDLLWVLDEKHKLKFFPHAHALISYFVNWRTSIYTERKKRLTKILEEKYANNSLLVKFIELVCDGKLVIRNRSKVDIKKDMDGYKLPMSLISTPMSKVTIEERDELLKENERIKQELEYIKSTSEKDMYINDLEDLYKKLKPDFDVKVAAINNNGEIVGTSKQSKEEKAVAKAKKEKEKAKKQKEKSKVSKEKEKAKKAKLKEKKQKEKEKDEKAKLKKKKADIKEKIQKMSDKIEKTKKLFEVAKIKKDKEKMIQYKSLYGEYKQSLIELKESLKNIN